jgi:aminopeptidase N
MDELFPEWKVWSQFVANEQAMGLGLDSLKSSHPVEVPIASAGQVGNYFLYLYYQLY